LRTREDSAWNSSDIGMGAAPWVRFGSVTGFNVDHVDER
jgi:hypothetical protein